MPGNRYTVGPRKTHSTVMRFTEAERRMITQFGRSRPIAKADGTMRASTLADLVRLGLVEIGALPKDSAPKQRDED